MDSGAQQGGPQGTPKPPQQPPTHQAQAQAQAQQSSLYPELLRVEEIDKLGVDNPETRAQWINGVTKFWQVLRTRPPTDPMHQTALEKLKNFTQKARYGKQQQQQQQQPAEQSSQPNAASTSAQGVQAAGQAGSQTGGQAGGQRPTSQGQGPPRQQTGTQPRNMTNTPWDQIPERYRLVAEKINWRAGPQHVQNAGAVKDEMKRRYAIALQSYEINKTNGQKLHNQIQQMTQEGKEVPEQMTKQCQQLKETTQQFSGTLQTIQNQQNEWKSMSANGGQAGNAPQKVAGNAPAVQGTVGNRQENQNGQVDVQNASQNPNNAISSGQQQPQAIGTTMSQQPNSGGNFTSGRQAPTNPNANLTQPGQASNPQTQITSQQPIALTHQTAMDAAARSYSNPPGAQQPVGGGQANSQALNRPEVEKAAGNKWPMTRNFSPGAPNPVTMPSARPTLTGTSNGALGTMGQPAIQQPPNFSLQGADDRVLDKKKLDELVRQVCGGGEEGHGQGLQPEVEESILQLADEFFDNVVASACRIAKLRGGQTLELRDIQLILQRQYNIRIPGYSIDETRVVKKVQPNASHLQKMNAIQAAKVMGGKTDL
ncbi:MAG: Transcription initiation factor TFIID subunit 12 [Alyxoria varia]|nr:MAG: Transcription initiation factor TFIID subunit 12 [Alyxoria varia]